MLNLMFWNLQHGSAVNLLGQACDENEVDILIVAEFSKVNVGSVINLGRTTRSYAELQSNSAHIRFFTRLPTSDVTPVADIDRASAQLFTLPSQQKILVVGVHLRSKANRNDLTQLINAIQIRSDIERFEKDHNTSNTVVIGDFNMNPFDAGMVTASAFHAMMDRRLVKRGSRVIAGQEHSFFYNPMWGRFGSETDGPSGTHYFGGQDVDDIYWHNFDQFIIRPALIDRYNECKALTDIGGTSLLSRHRLIGNFSDHLPIVAKFDM